jgi:hypothetical protein
MRRAYRAAAVQQKFLFLVVIAYHHEPNVASFMVKSKKNVKFVLMC